MKSWLDETKRLFKSKKQAEAVGYIKKHIRSNPASLLPQCMLAVIYKEMEKYKEAVEQYKKCAELSPSSPAVHNEMGNILFTELHNYRDASSSFQKAFKILKEAKEGKREINDEFTLRMFKNKKGMDGLLRYVEIRYHHAEMLLNLSISNAAGVKQHFSEAKRLTRKAEYKGMRPPWELFKLAEIDEKIHSLKDSASFDELRESVDDLLGILTSLASVKRKRKLRYHGVFQSKHDYLLALLDDVDPELRDKWKSWLSEDGYSKAEIEGFERRIFGLRFASMFFEGVKHTKAQQLINCLKNFRLEVKRFASPSEIPIEKQRQLIRSLVPFFDAVDGQMSMESIAKAQREILSRQAKSERRIIAELSKLPKELDSLLKKEISQPTLEKREEESEEEKLKTEPQKYLVFLPYKNKIGTRPVEVTEKTVKKKYLPNSDKYDIFIYTESIFVRAGKKMTRLLMHARLRKLLIMFLRYKDMSIPPIPLYRKAWADAPHRLIRIYEDKDVTKYIKPAKSQLETSIYRHVPSFEIDKPRSQGYICKGSFDFCVIIDSRDDKKYRLTEAKEPEDY